MEVKIPKKPIIIKNSDFQTIIVRVMFPFDDKEENLVKTALLPNLLMYMNNKYPTEDEFQKSRKKNYILSASCNKMTIGTNMCLCFSLVIPDTSALEFDHMDEQFSFFSEMIYNPKIIHNGFDKNEVLREMKNLKMSVENAMKNLKPYQAVKGLELVDDEGILSRTVDNHIEQLETITPKNLYKLYLEIISNCCPLVFVFGNTNEERINELADNYLYKNLSSVDSFEKKYSHFLKVNESDEKFIHERKDFKDSSISFYYKVKDMKEDDFNKLSLVRSLLSSQSSRMLNKKLRDENDLVYASKAVSYLRFGVFEITAYINRANKDIVIEKIKEVMEDLKNPDNIRDYLENIKERRRLSLIKSLDDKFTLFSDVILEKLDIEKNMNDNYKDVLKITAQDISEFVKRLKLDTIFFIEEDSHE